MIKLTFACAEIVSRKVASGAPLTRTVTRVSSGAVAETADGFADGAAPIWTLCTLRDSMSFSSPAGRSAAAAAEPEGSLTVSPPTGPPSLLPFIEF